MRGKPHIGVFRHETGRITPAHAGKTLLQSKICLSSADHPRACGENSVFLRLQPLHLGSPPRMRGKPIVERDTVATKRITPAHAGKTW